MQIDLLHAFVTPVVAQATPNGGSSLYSFLPIILFVAAMWFLIIAPQRKKQKEHDRMVKSLATGDEVLTSGGIFGVVTNVKDDRLVVRIAEGTKVEIGRSFVQAVTKKTSSN